MPPRSYRSPARSAAAEQTHARIVAAAAKLLGAKGSREFSLDVVAKRAKVTRLTIYNQFGSRRALLEAVFDDRALRGGLNRIPEAMSEPDPHTALDRLIAIFCDFWSFDQGTLARLHGMGTDDHEFEESIRARNERRRTLISLLVRRIVTQHNLPAAAATDLTDLLFVLTSFAGFAELSRSRSKAVACALLQETARSLVAKAGRQD